VARKKSVYEEKARMRYNERKSGKESGRKRANSER
jgi:hypothetical protein